jgi:hypothetical protein
VITACAFARDGRTVASASADTTVLIWDLSGQLRGVGPAPAPMVYVEARKNAADDFPAAGPPAPGPPDLATLWADLGGMDAVKAYRARWALAAVPKAVLPLLQHYLKPVPHLDAARLRRLLADLDAEDFPQREHASTELERLGTVVEPELRQLLVRTSSAEAFKRIKTLLDKLGSVGSTERIRDLRALEVLEAVGTTESQKFLEELAKGEPRAQLTQEARAALTRRGAG